jgi:mono/diheme cytochrome c family protein
MKKIINKMLVLAAIFSVSFFFAGATYSSGGGNKWVAPASTKNLKNPMAKLASNERALKAGAKLFAVQCATCHGESGKGNGPSAKFLEKRPQDLTQKDVLSQSDGELFWKITNGNAPMPAFEKIMNDNQRWMIVNFIKTLK